MKTDYCAECPKVNNCKNRGNTECEIYQKIEEGLKKNKPSAYDVVSCVVYVLTKILVGLFVLAVFGVLCIAGGMFLWSGNDLIPSHFSIFPYMVLNWALVGFLLIFGGVLLFLIGCLFKWLVNKWIDMFFNGQEKMEKLRWK